MTLDLLAPWDATDDVVLRSAMHDRFRSAGATFERRGAWEVPVTVPGEAEHLTRVAFADASHLPKHELRGGEPPAAGPEGHVLAVSPGRWIAVGRPGDAGPRRLALDMTGAWSLVVLAGPERERLLRRLGPVAEIPGGGPIAGVPGRVFRRGELLWVLVAVEYAQHVFDACADLSAALGGGPAGIDAVGDPLLAGVAAGAAG